MERNLCAAFLTVVMCMALQVFSLTPAISQEPAESLDIVIDSRCQPGLLGAGVRCRTTLTNVGSTMPGGPVRIVLSVSEFGIRHSPESNFHPP